MREVSASKLSRSRREGMVRLAGKHNAEFSGSF
jgi:hypothetical protein